MSKKRKEDACSISFFFFLFSPSAKFHVFGVCLLAFSEGTDERIEKGVRGGRKRITQGRDDVFYSAYATATAAAAAAVHIAAAGAAAALVTLLPQ